MARFLSRIKGPRLTARQWVVTACLFIAIVLAGSVLLSGDTITKIERDRNWKIQAYTLQRRTLWDWLTTLSQLSVPVLIAAGGWYLSERNASEQQAANQIRQEDSVVSNYIKEMTSLILDRGLGEPGPVDKVSIVARTLTLSALSQTSGVKKRRIILFIQEAQLIRREMTRVLLDGADLSEANLSKADLFDAELRSADLSGADLSGAKLVKADLRLANLSGANLSWAKLVEADLRLANLSSAHLLAALLNGANLSKADLRGAYLSMADLRGAYLSGAVLTGANLDGIVWDDETKWPDKPAFKDAKNIPPELKERRGLD